MRGGQGLVVGCAAFLVACASPGYHPSGREATASRAGERESSDWQQATGRFIGFSRGRWAAAPWQSNG